MGKWNGFGGKVESGETFEEAAIRELHEESSIRCLSLSSIGYLVFRLENIRKFMKVHVYETWEFEGEATESEEMRPEWYDERDIPYSRMWADDEVSGICEGTVCPNFWSISIGFNTC